MKDSNRADLQVLPDENQLLGLVMERQSERQESMSTFIIQGIIQVNIPTDFFKIIWDVKFQLNSWGYLNLFYSFPYYSEESTSGAFSTPALSISIDESDDDPTAAVNTPINIDDSTSTSSLEAYQSFDTVVGAIEDVAVGSEFQSLQSFYLSKYWKEFEGDENSESTHEQFMIFQNYSKEMVGIFKNTLF